VSAERLLPGVVQSVSLGETMVLIAGSRSPSPKCESSVVLLRRAGLDAAAQHNDPRRRGGRLPEKCPSGS